MTFAYTQCLQQTLDSVKNYKNKASPRKCASSLPTLRPLHRQMYLQFYAVPPVCSQTRVRQVPSTLAVPLTWPHSEILVTWVESVSQTHDSRCLPRNISPGFFFSLSQKNLNYDSVLNNLTLRSLKHASDLQECLLHAFCLGEEQRIVLQPETGTATPNVFSLSIHCKKIGKKKR